MSDTNFVPGRYVRSATEAERVVADADSKVGSSFPGYIKRAIRAGNDVEVVAGKIAVELCRRGYGFMWDVCYAAAVSGCSPIGGVPSRVEQAMRLSVDEIVDVVIAQRLVSPEPDRETAAHSWSELAADDPHGDDWYDAHLDSRPGERKARDRRFWGMQNRAMRDKLERGECVDVSTFRRVSAKWHTIASDPFYVIPIDVFQSDVDFCDSNTETWIWSIGRHRASDELHASTTGELYQNPDYECVWLR